MTNPIVEKVEEWILGIALKKAAYSAVKVVAAFIASVKVAPVMAQLGVTVDPVTMEGGLTALLTSGMTMLQNWLKVKYNLSWL